MKRSGLTAAMMVLCALHALAQTGTIKGFVFDASNGQPLPLASVVITSTGKGVVTDAGGFFLLMKIPAGSQTIKVSFLGYQDWTATPMVRANGMEQIVVQLRPQVIQLEPATINAERIRLQRLNPVSTHHLTQVTLKKVPGMTGQSDLAEYLQVIPGIIFTGDRGGQFYVRGGAPVQNLVKIDGMTVISPFHSLGFASVFDTETIGSVDVLTAGYEAPYGGRISSVIDVKTRMGNRREFKTRAAVNTFGYGLLVEGPLKKMTPQSPSSLSVILSNKGSYINRTSGTLYPYLDSTGLPFGYNDLFGKVSLVGRRGDQLDLIGMHFTDAADYSSLIRTTWETNGGGMRFLITPVSSKLLFESGVFFSVYNARYKETTLRPRTTRYQSFEVNTKIYYRGPVMKLEWGTEMNFVNTLYTFARQGNLYTADEYFAAEILTYVDTKFEMNRLLVEPGFRIHYYADQVFVSPEPRLKLRYRINDLLNLNLATGLYSQNLVSTTSPEDVVNLFQGFYIGPGFVQDTYRGAYIRDKIQLAWHAVGGLSYLGPKNLKLSLEGYVKDYYRLIDYNRNRLYDLLLNADNVYPEYLMKFFIIEKGWAYGLDFLADWNTPSWSLYLAYSLGYVFRQDEFMEYLPHYDRRHNLNFVGGYRLGRNKTWEIKTRWNLGSGFPFTQSYGLYENLVTGRGRFTLDPLTAGQLTIWYAPLNRGRLPWYHRLDVSLQKTWQFLDSQVIELSLGIMNLYNRQNVFYVDRVTMKRVNQLPILPTLGFTWRF
jgi:hypothetical protein